MLDVTNGNGIAALTFFNGSQLSPRVNVTSGFISGGIFGSRGFEGDIRNRAGQILGFGTVTGDSNLLNGQVSFPLGIANFEFSMIGTTGGVTCGSGSQ